MTERTAVNVRAILVGLLSVPHTPEQAEHAAETVLDLHAHELAEQIRQHYGKPPLGGDHPENYPNGYNAGTHNAADFIDPKAQRAATTGDTT